MLHNLALIIELLGTFIITYYCAWAGVDLVKHRGIRRAKRIVAKGALYGLTIKTAATFLKFIELQTFQQISVFVIVLALRQILKKEFQMT